jgi:hypothetical protein
MAYIYPSAFRTRKRPGAQRLKTPFTGSYLLELDNRPVVALLVPRRLGLEDLYLRSPGCKVKSRGNGRTNFSV